MKIANGMNPEDSKQHNIIVIGREFGSGGSAVGHIVAEKLGIPYYDKELLAEAAYKLGFTTSVFAEADERRPSMFRSLVQGLYGVPDIFNTESMSDEGVYQFQSRVIREICTRESCVVVGRTADYVMRDHPRLTSVFLHAPIEYRADRIIRRGDASTIIQAKELARKNDKNRQEYYNFFTSRSNWGKASNYHIAIDASRLSDEEAADLIISFAANSRPKVKPTADKNQK